MQSLSLNVDSLPKIGCFGSRVINNIYYYENGDLFVRVCLMHPLWDVGNSIFKYSIEKSITIKYITYQNQNDFINAILKAERSIMSSAGY